MSFGTDMSYDHNRIVAFLAEVIQLDVSGIDTHVFPSDTSRTILCVVYM